MKTHGFSFIIGTVVAIATALPGHSATILVANFDFTNPTVSGYILAPGAGPSGSTTPVPDWTFADSESVGGLADSANVPVGVAQDAFFNNTADGTQLNTLTYSGTGLDALPSISANTNYTLTVALGVPGINYGATYYLSLLANGSSPTGEPIAIPSSSLILLPATSGYTNFYDATVTLNAATILADGLVGQQLGIQLESEIAPGALPYADLSQASQTYFSDVRLDTAAVPEPSTYALMLGGFGLLVYCRSRKYTTARG